jgi:putative nucleotidyltransferase with HDIG domain
LIPFPAPANAAAPAAPPIAPRGRAFRGVGWKIMAPFLLLTAIFAVLGTFLVTRLVTGSLEERFSNQLIQSARVASDSAVRTERRQLESVRAISFATGVAAATDRGDSAELERIVVPFAANAHVERVEIVGRNGARIFSATLEPGGTVAYDTTTAPADRSAWPMVARTLSPEADPLGDKFSGLVDEDGWWMLYTSAPIREGDRIVGVALVGTSAASFLAGARSEALADVTLFDPAGALVGTTFPDATESGQELTPRAPLQALTNSGAGRQRALLFGRSYEVLYSEFRLRNEPAGYVAVALPADYITAAGSTARTQMALLFAGITLAVAFMGWWLARLLTRPLDQLVATTRAVTAGDLTARTRISRRDEIGDLARSFDVMTEKLQRQHLATIGALTSAIDARDPYTAGHSMRVGLLSAELGGALGLPAAHLQHLEVGGYLHDIGKIGVRDSVLLKEGTLDARERELIERHPQIGLEILQRVELPPEVIALVGGHHEKLDGTGYPSGLKADEITIFPRIAAVADIYDALTTDRPYRAAMSVAEALELLEREARSGRVDPEVLRALRALVPAWEVRRRDDPLLSGYRLSGELFRKAS